MKNVSLKVSARKDKEGKEYFEGTVSIPGVKATKLVKGDGCSQFANKAGVQNAAKKWAEKLELELVMEEAAEVKKAAKESAKKPAKKAKKAKSAETPSKPSCSEPSPPNWTNPSVN